MAISGSVTLRRKPEKGEKGDNAVSVYASPAALVFQEGETSKSFTVYVTDGGKTVDPTEYGISYIDDYGLADQDVNQNVFTVIIGNGDNESGYVTLEVSYNDNDYELTVPWSVAVKGEKGNDGTSVTIKGTLTSSADLPTTGNTVGDGYLIDGYLYVWTAEGKWQNVGQIKGDKGEDAIVPYASPSCVSWTCGSNGKISTPSYQDITIGYRKGANIYTANAEILTSCKYLSGFASGKQPWTLYGDYIRIYPGHLEYQTAKNLQGEDIYIAASTATVRAVLTIDGASYTIDIPVYINNTVYSHQQTSDLYSWHSEYAQYCQDNDGNIETLKSDIKQTASDINLSVEEYKTTNDKRVSDVETDVSNYKTTNDANITSIKSQIDLKADSVSLTALKDNLQKAGIIVGLDEGGNGYINIAADGLLTINTTNCQLTADGTLTAKNGTFENVLVDGSIRSPWAQATSDMDTNLHDNVVLRAFSDNDWVNTYSLPWTASQSGRRVTLANYKWGGSSSGGYGIIDAPSGQYFYDDGQQKSRIYIAQNEVVELLGYGDTSTFYGWIVFSRKYIQRSLCGQYIPTIMMGYVYGGQGTTEDPLSHNIKCYDGSTTYSVTRVGAGKYRVYWPTSWRTTIAAMGTTISRLAQRFLIQATGIRGALDQSGDFPIKATVYAITSNYIEFYTSDDATVNDGAFFFEVKLMDDMRVNA